MDDLNTIERSDFYNCYLWLLGLVALLLAFEKEL